MAVADARAELNEAAEAEESSATATHATTSMTGGLAGRLIALAARRTTDFRFGMRPFIQIL